LRKFVMFDRGRRDFGETFWREQGLDPRGDGVYVLWTFLTKEERDYWTEWLRFVAARGLEMTAQGHPEPTLP